jgi:hypothetical protein
MIDRRGAFRLLVTIAIVQAMSGIAPFVKAQERDAAEAADLVIERELTDDEFESSVDQVIDAVHNRNSPEGGRLDERLTLKLDWIQAACKISEAQKKKLQIAGRGDIKRFVDEVHALKRQYRQVKADPAELGKVQARLAELQASARADLFGDSSLFLKMLKNTLSAEQAGAYARAVDESRAFAHQAAASQAVQVCDMAVGLNDEQRRRLTGLFELETRQMERKAPTELTRQLLIILETSKLSRAKLKAIFDDRQWIVMSALLKQLEDGERLEIDVGPIEQPVPPPDDKDQ